MTKSLPTLKPGDHIEIIAPASRCADSLLNEIVELLQGWNLNCTVSPDIFGEDILCANSDEKRFQALQSALENPKTQAILCARGGYGSMRLIPKLSSLKPVTQPKLFIGMSDITALHLFLQQQWGWPCLHGAAALDKFSIESIQALKSVMFGEVSEIVFAGTPLNKQAEFTQTIHSTLTGGNLCIVQSGIGTTWQMNPRDKIILLEEISERGYRVDRMLEHLTQAGQFNHAKAIVFADFIEGNEPNGTSLVPLVLERFAKSLSVPALQIAGVGHGKTSIAVPLGTHVQLELGENIKMTISK